MEVRHKPMGFFIHLGSTTKDNDISFLFNLFLIGGHFRSYMLIESRQLFHYPDWFCFCLFICLSVCLFVYFL